MSVLLFSGFDTFHAQETMSMTCRTFAIDTLPCCLILNKVMLDLTEEKVCFKEESTLFGINLEQSILKHIWSTCNFILLLTGGNSALKSFSKTFLPSDSC